MARPWSIFIGSLCSAQALPYSLAVSAKAKIRICGEMKSALETKMLYSPARIALSLARHTIARSLALGIRAAEGPLREEDHMCAASRSDSSHLLAARSAFLQPVCAHNSAESPQNALVRQDSPSSSFRELCSDLCSASGRVLQPRGPMVDECRRQ
jgi:hypothetical protein